jgi:hypothetical protein
LRVNIRKEEKRARSELRGHYGKVRETPHSEIKNGCFAALMGQPHGFIPSKLYGPDDLSSFYRLYFSGIPQCLD